MGGSSTGEFLSGRFDGAGGWKQGVREARVYREQAKELLEMLDSDDLDERLVGIQVLGEIGDEDALEALRERMAMVNKELHALVVAVGKLKRKLEVK